MIEILRYEDRFSDEIRALFESLAKEIDHNGDVRKETMHVAVEEGAVVGVCFLLETSSYRYADRKRPGYLGMELEVKPMENEVEISAMLMDTLIYEYRRICDAEGNKRLILRTFCYSSSVEYMNFLSWLGFRAQHFMYRMKKDLTETVPNKGNGNFEFVITRRNGRDEKIEVETVDAETEGATKKLEGYFEANKRVFGVPDSENELRYRLKEQKGIQFLARSKGKVIAAVSVWENKPDNVSTENIFCIKEYRRLGVTEKLLGGVCAYLAGRGYKEASLYVYGVNTYAVELYRKLGYVIYGGLIHMLYEDGYVPEMI
ncbi:MAG: GNAT family N-acetyltransferase [Lachnospiraceae bacterium]|nr:GNAT family N-acetyltransferase [Lachnospiraceae bacterium]